MSCYLLGFLILGLILQGDDSPVLIKTFLNNKTHLLCIYKYIMRLGGHQSAVFLLIYEIEISQVITSFYHHIKTPVLDIIYHNLS